MKKEEMVNENPIEEVKQEKKPTKTKKSKDPITVEDIRRATEILQKYKQGKANLDNRIIENEQWWKMRHWDQMRTANKKIEPTSAWLFNSIANKHADAMDNYPSAVILPREESDDPAARTLTAIIPAILDANNYEQTYSDTWWYKLKQGTGVKGVFWDNSARNGLGDISIKRLDILNLFWEPGITDIQKSRNFFNVELRDNAVLQEEYPEYTFTSGQTISIGKYIFEDTIDTTNKSLVIDWYYKKEVTDVDENGEFFKKNVLHYCKFVNEYILYSSENDPNYTLNGYYDHGKYPVVFDVLYPEESTPAGFGYIDIMKSDQEYIDKLDQSILENALVCSKKRFFSRIDGGVNEEDFLDINKPIVRCDGNLGDDSLKEIRTTPLSNIYYNIRQGKIDELKETSGNRDFSQGATSSGVTAASAIAALQESGSKLSRDMIKSAYRNFVQECYLIIELIRQFYDEPRMFRITNKVGYEFTTFDNTDIRPQPQGEAFGIALGNRVPIFDIKVSAEKRSTYSTMSQNEFALQLYGQGFFNPQLADQAIACLDMMEFEGKENVLEKIMQGSQLLNQMQAMQEQLNNLTTIIDAQNGTTLGMDLQGMQGKDPGGKNDKGSMPKPKIDMHKTLAQKSQEIAQEAAAPR